MTTEKPTTEELIKQARRLVFGKLCPPCDEAPVPLDRQLIDLRVLVSDLADALEAATKPRWIPCSERLPEFLPGKPTYNNSRVGVIGAFEGGNVREIIWARNWAAIREKNRVPRWEYPGNGGLVPWTPTHWMPLPEPPTKPEQD